MAIKKQSVEPKIADLANGWLKSYELDYKLEQESLNSEIDKALEEYLSKSGGKGGNKPDAKLLLSDKYNNYYPVLIEYKGYKDKLVKLNSNAQVENKNDKGETLFKNINSYAVNGAVHYANALLHYTTYSDIIAIGMTGYKNEKGKIVYSIGVYYVSKNNLGFGQKVDDYTDFSFLKKENFDDFIEKVKKLNLTQKELDELKEKREREINASLIRLNNDIYQNEDGLGENDRVYLVAASIIATLGVPGKNPGDKYIVTPLEKSDLKSSTEQEQTDGEIIIRKIRAFLSQKKLPRDKIDLVVRTLQNTLCTDNINRPVDGESQLKRVFSKIVDDLGIYYKIGLTTDFTGRLFNEMYSWLGFTQDKLNDVVLTPSYVSKLLVKLARVNKDSYVWDYATGSAGLLVAAMNEMLNDAKEKIKSPKELEQKITEIKAKQLLGLEILPNVYILAVLNMILMGDGSSNIFNKDSLNDFDGNYKIGDEDQKFPATAFVLNPPYSKPGCGMIFVKEALSKMNSGYAAIIIQSSAGSGKAKEYNVEILKHSTLLASIKMPNDLFVGKSNVQTCVYVFRVGEAHQNDDIVKFIDFSDDGYARTNRKKAANNLKDVNHAEERYQEVVDLVRFGKSKLNIFTEKEYYEGTIDITNGADWNKTAPVDTKPTELDFKKAVASYLCWKADAILKEEGAKTPSFDSNCWQSLKMDFEKNGGEWKQYKVRDLFYVVANPQLNKENFVFSENAEYPYFTRTVFNNGILGYVEYLDDEHLIKGNSLAVGMLGMQFFYMQHDFYAGQFTKTVYPKFEYFNEKIATYFIVLFNKFQKKYQDILVRDFEKIFYDSSIELPVLNGEIAFSFMESCIHEFGENQIRELEVEHVHKLAAYRKAIGVAD